MQTSSHTPIFNLAPAVSSSSLAAIQIPSLCLSKAQCGNNKRSAAQVMEDKQRQVCVTPAGLGTQRQRLRAVDKLMVCVSVAAAAVVAVLLVCVEEGQLRRRFVWILWQRGAAEGGQAGSIEQQHFPMWQHSTQTC